MKVTEEQMVLLVEAAKQVRHNAYAPYSNYRVGAALLTDDGHTFTGCNFENASYGACICAERGAVAQMIASGRTRPIACAVATGGKTAGSPCGICRQVLIEFARDMPVALVCEHDDGTETRRDTSLAALLPDSFVFP
jgi:cytidine deaminase